MRGRGRHGRGRHGGGGVHIAQGHQPAAVPGSSAAAAAGEEDDDDELAEFKREAAQLMQKAQQQQQLPAGLNSTTLASATKQLQNAVGIGKDDAEEALIAVFDEHGANYDQWLDEAQLWLAVRAEADTEAEKLKEAMEVSLREQAEKRAAEQAAAPPLVNLSEDRLRRKFAGSAVLPCLEKCMPGTVLFSDASPLRELVKFKLVDLLRLESNCCKWYPDAGTQHYFAAFGERCVQQLTSSRCSCSQISFEVVKLEQQQQREPSPAPQPVKHSQKQQSSADQQHVQGYALDRQSDLGAANGRTSMPPDAAALSGGLAPAAAAAAGGPAGATLISTTAVGGPASEPCSHASDAADADHSCGVKRSSRKRQAPSRFRSPSPGASDTMSGASKPKGSRKRTATPETAAVPAKAARVAGATSVASSRAPSVDGAAMPPPPVRMSPDVCAGPVAAAATASSNTIPAVLSQLQPHGQQQQQQSYQDQRLADLCSALGQHPVVVKQLSQMLAEEHTAVQEAIYAMPGTSGAVPSIFRGNPDGAAAEQEGSDSDLEVVEAVSASTAAATMAKRRTCSSAGNGGESTAAAAAAPQSSCAAAAAPPPPSPATAAAGSGPRSGLALAADPAPLVAGLPAPAAALAAQAGPGEVVQPPGPMAYAVRMPAMPGYPANVQMLQAYALQQQAAQQQVLQQLMLQQQAMLQQHAALQQRAAQQQLPDDDDVIIID